MAKEVTLVEIRAAAKRLAIARNESVSRSTALQEAISSAIGPIYTSHRAGIDSAAEEEAAANAELKALVESAPQLFIKPRSISEDGVKCGYRKSEEMLDWEDEAQVIARIRALQLDLSGVMIRTVESLNVAALSELDGNELRRIGVRRIAGIDQAYVSFTDSDVEKLVKAIMADAAKRQGEEEPVKKKGKAKIKEVS